MTAVSPEYRVIAREFDASFIEYYRGIKPRGRWRMKSLPQWGQDQKVAELAEKTKEFLDQTIGKDRPKRGIAEVNFAIKEFKKFSLSYVFPGESKLTHQKVSDLIAESLGSLKVAKRMKIVQLAETIYSGSNTDWERAVERECVKGEDLRNLLDNIEILYRTGGVGDVDYARQSGLLPMGPADEETLLEIVSLYEVAEELRSLYTIPDRATRTTQRMAFFTRERERILRLLGCDEALYQKVVGAFQDGDVEPCLFQLMNEVIISNATLVEEHVEKYLQVHEKKYGKTSYDKIRAHTGNLLYCIRAQLLLDRVTRSRSEQEYTAPSLRSETEELESGSLVEDTTSYSQSRGSDALFQSTTEDAEDTEDSTEETTGEATEETTDEREYWASSGSMDAKYAAMTTSSE